MDVRFINPFIAATKSVFSTMVDTEIVIGRPSVIPAHEEHVVSQSRAKPRLTLPCTCDLGEFAVGWGE